MGEAKRRGEIEDRILDAIGNVAAIDFLSRVEKLEKEKNPLQAKFPRRQSTLMAIACLGGMPTFFPTEVPFIATPAKDRYEMELPDETQL